MGVVGQFLDFFPFYARAIFESVACPESVANNTFPRCALVAVVVEDLAPVSPCDRLPVRFSPTPAPTHLFWILSTKETWASQQVKLNGWPVERPLVISLSERCPSLILVSPPQIPSPPRQLPLKTRLQTTPLEMLPAPTPSTCSWVLESHGPWLPSTGSPRAWPSMSPSEGLFLFFIHLTLSSSAWDSLWPSSAWKLSVQSSSFWPEDTQPSEESLEDPSSSRQFHLPSSSSSGASTSWSLLWRCTASSSLASKAHTTTLGSNTWAFAPDTLHVIDARLIQNRVQLSVETQF